MMKFLEIPPFGQNHQCEILYHNIERMKTGVYPKNKVPDDSSLTLKKNTDAKVPWLALMIQEVDWNGRDASVILKDVTGSS